MTNTNLSDLTSAASAVAKQLQSAAEKLAIGTHNFDVSERVARMARETLAIREVYGKPLSELKPPDGWDWLIEDGRPAFRAPRIQSGYVTTETYLEPHTLLADNWQNTQPRLVLRRKPKPRRYVFEIVGYNRPPKKGEFHLSIYTNGAVCIQEAVTDHSGACQTILRLVERPDA
jgi:hypothetical protein